MDTGTLKKLRSAVPGTLVLIGLVPLYTYFTETPLGEVSPTGWLMTGAIAAGAYAIGMLYNVYCVRALFNRQSHEKITENIKQRLLTMGRTSPISDAKREELKSGTALMNTFYSLIDSTDSLKEKGKLVRENGLVWSSVADIVVLGSLSASFYFPVWFYTDYALFLYWAVISVILALISGLVLHPKVERRHIELSNEQLDFIESQLKDEVMKKVNAL